MPTVDPIICNVPLLSPSYMYGYPLCIDDNGGGSDDSSGEESDPEEEEEEESIRFLVSGQSLEEVSGS